MEIPLIKDKDGYILKVSVKTGSKKAGIEGIDEDIIRIRVRSQPHDGAANIELLEILSEFLKEPKSKMEIIKGLTSKNKFIRIKRK